MGGRRSGEDGGGPAGGDGGGHAGGGHPGDDQRQRHQDEGGGPGVGAGDLVGSGELADGAGEPVVGAVGEGAAAPDDDDPQRGVSGARAQDEPAGGVAVDPHQGGGDQS